MAIVKMKKANIIALQSEKNDLVKRLQKFANLHLVNTDEILEDNSQELVSDDDTERVNQLESRLSQIKYSLDFINKYDKSKKPLFPSKQKISENEYKEYFDNEKKSEYIYDSCRSIDVKLAEIKNSQTKANNLISLLEPWSSLDLDLNSIGNTKNTVVTIGFVLSKYSEEFKNDISASEIEVYQKQISIGKENTFILLIYHNDVEDFVAQIQKQYGWSKVSFNDLLGTPYNNIDKLKTDLESYNEQKDVLAKQAEELKIHKDYLEIMFDILNIERDRSIAVKNFARTEKTFMVHGWVPEKYGESLVKAIEEVTDKYYIYFQEAEEEEEFPVLLDNPKIVKPLEMITEQYSLPNSRSLDPNIIMAPFYVMFFGMMISDAGYGIVLAISTLAALYFLKPAGGLKKVLGLLCLGGVSTFFWGIMFGGWFGDFGPKLGLGAVLFDPLKEPIKMLFFCLILGIIQLYVGMGIQLYKNIKSGNIFDGIVDQGLWYLLLTGLIFLGLGPLAVIGKYMSIVGVVGLILFAGRKETNIIKRLLLGVLSLYNVTGYLGDVLSYSRLFALGLATGVIGTVVNAMASMMGGSFFGNIIMVIGMVFGHTFNIAINLLGAYVHSSRLQYVEFFSKFYEGDGKPFTPFKASTKFIDDRI